MITETYLGSLIILSIFCLIIRKFLISTDSIKNPSENAEFDAFQRNYALVMVLAGASDWIQGPYIYALYSEYGFSKVQIGNLFVAGYSSGALFGSFAGILADKFGRKFMVYVFGILFTVSCLANSSSNFAILFGGRLITGIATSLLHTVFEAWMISEHHSRNFPSRLLSSTFSYTSILNAIVAISSGLIGSVIVSQFGLISPFAVSILLLIAMLFIVHYTWNENHGNRNAKISRIFVDAFQTIRYDPNIQFLCAVQTLFESSMFVFIFAWTPTLKDAVSLATKEELPLGLVFACFMVAVMIGSSIFDYLLNKTTAERIGDGLFVLGTTSMTLLMFVTDYWHLTTFCFILFEVSCGLYWPCFGTIRSKLIPENCRSGVSNLMRIPIYAFVSLLLNMLGNKGNKLSYMVCSILLLTGLFVHSLTIDVSPRLPLKRSREIEAKFGRLSGELSQLEKEDETKFEV